MKSKRLTAQLSSDYFEAAQKLRPSRSRRRIIAYVESYDDVFFWRSLFSLYENDKRYFEVMLPTRRNLSKGKKSVLMNIINNNAGEYLLACVDADYDYLLDQATKMSQDVNNNPYVLHTYAYAIENLQCYAPSLHDVCVMVTLNDSQIFNFEEYLKLYSKAVFPLFVWSIWFYSKNKNNHFTIADFNKVIEPGRFHLKDPMMTIENVRHKVKNRIQLLAKQNPDVTEKELNETEQNIRAHGVTPETTYLYIQGHHLFDNVVIPVLAKVCDRLVTDREHEIRQKAIHGTQMRNELSCYSHSTADIITMLRRNTGYRSSEQFQRLCHDLEDILSHKHKESNDNSQTT